MRSARSAWKQLAAATATLVLVLVQPVPGLGDAPGRGAAPSDRPAAGPTPRRTAPESTGAGQARSLDSLSAPNQAPVPAVAPPGVLTRPEFQPPSEEPIVPGSSPPVSPERLPGAERAAAQAHPRYGEPCYRRACRTGRLPAPAGREVPINLPTALRLAGASNLDIALARERTVEALEFWNQARVGWLPSLVDGVDYMHHDGQLQRSTGQLAEVSKSSLFAGGGPVAILPLGDVILEPLYRRRLYQASQFAAAAQVNDTLRQVSDLYWDVLEAEAEQAVAAAAAIDAATFTRLSYNFYIGPGDVRHPQGKGSKADWTLAQSELYRLRDEQEQFYEDVRGASSRLARELRVDPRVTLRPVEPNLVPITIIPPAISQDTLIVLGLRYRPELAEHQALVQATLTRVRQAGLRPFLPTLYAELTGGTFGGGRGGRLEHFEGRDDFEFRALWTLQNLGLGDVTFYRLRQSQNRQEVIRLLRQEDEVAQEVVEQSDRVALDGQRMTEATKAVASAIATNVLKLRQFRAGIGLPIEIRESIRILADRRLDYARAVAEYDRAEFDLYWAMGRPPLQTLASDPRARLCGGRSGRGVPADTRTRKEDPKPRGTAPTPRLSNSRSSQRSAPGVRPIGQGDAAGSR